MYVLNSKKQKCVQMLVQGDKTQKQIAEELKISEATICNWKKDEEFDAAYTTALKEEMKGIAAKALKTEIKLLSAKSEMVRLLTAKDLLDRAGFKPDDNMNLNGIGRVVIIDDCNQ